MQPVMAADELLDVADSPEALQALLAERGWGDGLPVVAPTVERVAAMLGGLGDVDPDEVVATLPPRFARLQHQLATRS